MQPVTIEYRLKLNEETTETFKFQLDGNTFDLIYDEIPDPPPWTKLSYRQCSHCTLSEEDTAYCPMALQLFDFVERFHGTSSIDKVELEVITEERRVIQTLAIQNAIASMLGFISPVCGCPMTAYMKPMARFHLPLASEEETVFRVTGMYLLSQYFINNTSGNGQIELDGLRKVYKDLHIVNSAIASRIQAVTPSDSLKNAITLLDMYSLLVPLLLDDQLIEMRSFFGAYLADGGSGPVTTNHLEKAKAFSMELVPLESDPDENDSLPEWIKDVARVKEPDREEQPLERSTETVEQANSILKNSGLNLELEPKADELEQNEPQSLIGTKAVFKLPDD